MFNGDEERDSKKWRLSGFIKRSWRASRHYLQLQKQLLFKSRQRLFWDRKPSYYMRVFMDGGGSGILERTPIARMAFKLYEILINITIVKYSGIDRV